MPTTFKIFAMAVLPLFLLNCGTETRSTELQENALQLISTGADFYKKWSCGTCHGELGEGTPKGPSLQNLVNIGINNRLRSILPTRAA